MKKIVLISGVFVSLLALFALFSEAFGWGLDYRMDSKRSWDEVKDIPVVSAMGHWNESPFQQPYDLKTDVFPLGTSEEKWIRIAESSGFEITVEDNKCKVGVYAIDYLKEYDVCAWRSVGPSACSYSYRVAANFDAGLMTDVIATKSHFICL